MAASEPVVSDQRAEQGECRYCGIQPGQELPRPSYYEMRREVERLRALLHDIAVARRGDCPDVDEQWERLPQEVERMWRDLHAPR